MTAMGHLEPVVSIVRMGGAYGEPCYWACMLRHLSPGSVIVEGAPHSLKPSQRRDFARLLRASGITQFRFVRRKRGGKVTHRSGRTDELATHPVSQNQE